MGNTLSSNLPVKYGPGINKTFSMPGYPTSYVQINELGLKQCLTNQTDQNIINSCIYKNILAPSVNNTLSGISIWSSEQLPPNPACKKKSSNQPTIIFAPKLSPEISTYYSKILNNDSFQKIDSSEESELNKKNYLILIIIIIITLIIMLK